MNFTELTQAYLNSPEFSVLSTNSQTNYRSKAKHLLFMNGEWSRIIDMDVSNSTKKAYLAVLSTILNWGKEHEIEGDFPKIPKLRLKSTPKDKQVYTKAEIEKIWKNAYTLEDKIYANFLRCLFYTGCRPSELFDLKWKDVDEDYINLRSTKRQECGKIGRKCAIIEPVKECLKVAKWVWEETGFGQISPDNNVFKSRRAGELTKQYTGVFIKRLTSENCVAPKQLRHARSGFATAAYHAGYSIYDIQGFLGHSSIDTTERYIRPTMEQRASQYKGV